MVEVSHFGLSVPKSVTPCIVPDCETLCSHVLQEASLVLAEKALLLEKLSFGKISLRVILIFQFGKEEIVHYVSGLSNLRSARARQF